MSRLDPPGWTGTYFTFRRSVILLLAGVIFVFAATLLPISETSPVARSGPSFLRLHLGIERGLDIVENVLLFLPLGLGLTASLASRILGRGAIFGIVPLSCFALSFVIEVTQSFLPSRFPSWIDVFCNTGGGFFALFTYHRWVGKDARWSFLSYLLFLLVLLAPLQCMTRLSNWDPAYSLILGNEATGDRPWQGRVSRLSISDKVLDKNRIERLLSDETAFSSSDSFWLASYDLRGLLFRDSRGFLPDLVPAGTDAPETGQGGVALGPHSWLRTSPPAASLSRRLRETSHFTLSVRFAAENDCQRGPARIVSLSRNPYQRNFTLGQDGSSIVFRLRTPLTGLNGIDPELIVPAACSRRDLQTVVVTYDGASLRVYTGGTPQPKQMTLNPGWILFGEMLPNSAAYMKTSYWLYLAFVLVPLGMLLRQVAGSAESRLRVPLLMGGILLSPVILETCPVLVCGRPLELCNVYLGMAFTAAALMLPLVRAKVSRLFPRR